MSPPSSAVPLAYLISQYPAINHTYILREVRILRTLGLNLCTISIRAADRPLDQLAVEEREEAQATFYVIPRGLWYAVRSHVALLATQPARYLDALRECFSLAGWNPGRFLAYLFYFAEAGVVARYARSRGVRHLHSHFSSTVALLACRMGALQMSATIHGPAEFDDVKAFHMAEKIRQSQFLVAISFYSRSQILRSASLQDCDKVHVIPLGVDLKEFAPRPFRPAPARFEIVTVGRVAEVKGLPELLRAVAILSAQKRSLRLRIVGAGPMLDALQRETARLGLQQQIVFCGWKNIEAVREIYRETDIFAMASLAEGVPVVLMEAMAMEIACVATRIMGVPELIRDEIDGLLVAPSNAEELATAIVRLMDDPALRRRLGESGRARVQEKYDVGRNGELLYSLLRKETGC